MALAHCSSHHPADDVPTRPSAASLLQSVIIFYLVSDFFKKIIQTGHQQVNCAFRLKIVALMIVIILCGNFFFRVAQKCCRPAISLPKAHFSAPALPGFLSNFPTCGAKKHVHVAGPFDVIERIPEILWRLLLDD